jgi:hypothetical protein
MWRKELPLDEVQAMITRVRQTQAERELNRLEIQGQRMEQLAEEWAIELNWIYTHDNPTCRRAIELETYLDEYWSDKPDWTEEELIEIRQMSKAG